ncbi:hypothetical protein GOODEAATRI_033223 [Goodea atripinnis]|uniref:Tyr recombinase domain-containing protein n=1 Tax=Goodea atripinnis TaxID=208336 RepID=A0ABV0PTR2_9TELE
MSEGQQKISDWTFLHNVERIKKWVSEMGQSGKEITTLRFYIHHAFQFVEYMVNCRPHQCRLTRQQTKEILLYLEKARKDTGRPIMVHQSRVKRAKMARIPQSASILKCLQLAPERVEKLLDELEEDTSRTATRYVLYGYLCAYWACMTGHRPSVFTNMRESDVATAELEASEEGVQIRVADHKTTLQFGEASLVLTRAEFSWIKRLHNVKEKLDSSNPYVLFTLGQQPFKHINRYLRVAWKKMDLKGDINFTLIRTALADCAKFTLPAATREQVSTSMCHDTRTADRFYSHNLTLKEGLRVREVMTSMLQSPGARGSTQDTQKASAKGRAKAKAGVKASAEERSSSDDSESEDETPVPYQESGDSSSSSLDSAEKAERPLKVQHLSPSKRQPASCTRSSISAKVSPLKRATVRLLRSKLASDRVKRALNK